MVIGLLGFEFESPNKGCEALSYAFIDLLHEYFNNQNVEIEYLSNCALGKIPELYPNFNFKRTPQKIKDPTLKIIRTMMRCDFIFDVTMGDSFSDIYSKKYCAWMMRYKQLAEFFCKKYVLLPQTYGPFSNITIREKAIKILENAFEIYSRDEQSQEYIKQIGVTRKIKPSIDMAFVLPYDKQKYNISKESINLGINVSGLLWRGGFDGKNQFQLKLDYQSYMSEILGYYSETPNIKVHLIPHVIDLKKDSHDDDYKLLIELNKHFPKTTLAPAFVTPIEAKSYISNMDCFIGARMHSTVASFSSGVATIPVSYSRKFEGLFNSLGYDYLIHGKEDTTMDAFKKTIEFVDKYKMLGCIVREKAQNIEKKCAFLRADLASLLEDKNN